MPASEFGGTEMIKKYERSDRPARAMGQRAAHRETVAEIDAAGDDHHVERIAGKAIAGRRVFAGKKAHFVPHTGEGNRELARILNVGVVRRLSNIRRGGKPQAQLADRQCRDDGHSRGNVNVARRGT
jgi:hypothetical protein